MAEETVARVRSDFYVYVIFRPNGIPCYVGKGTGKRMYHHKRFGTNRHLRNLYRKYGDLPIAMVRCGLTNAAACETEIALIAAIGRRGLETGPLVNLTDGGDTPGDFIRTEEWRAKMSAALKGRVFSPEWRKHMSDVRIGKPRSVESRLKQSAAVIGVKKPWISVALKGRPNPRVRSAQIGRKSPEQSRRMKWNTLGATLPEASILEIFHRAWCGESHAELAKEFDTKKNYISHIANAYVWKKVLSPLLDSKLAALGPTYTKTIANRRRAKITEEIAREILARSRSGESDTCVGKAFGVSATLVYNIRHGKAWQSVARTL